MTRAEAIKILMGYSHTPQERAALEVLIPELTESEDERIRKAIIGIIKNSNVIDINVSHERMLAYLENSEYVFRPLAGTDITIAAEQAIRRANEGDRLVLAFNGAYIPVRKGCNANKIVDIYDAFIKKQEEASKAIEAVDRIDNYIDENLANAHDMKDSNPDKKYCQGIDDTLAGIAWILQDVYSNEKQKEQKTAEWSEEDENMLWNIISIVGESKSIQADEMLDWLKSLRKCPKPSDRWKPSEEQMEALEETLETYKGFEEYDAMKSLYEQLKKL